MQVFSFSMDKGFLVKTWSRERVIDIPDGKYLVQFKGDAPFIEVGGELVFLNFQATAVPTKLYGFSIEKLEAVTPVFTTIEMAIKSGKAIDRKSVV